MAILSINSITEKKVSFVSGFAYIKSDIEIFREKYKKTQ